MCTKVEKTAKDRDLSVLISEQCDVELVVSKKTDEKTYKVALKIFKKGTQEEIITYDLSKEDIKKLGHENTKYGLTKTKTFFEKVLKKSYEQQGAERLSTASYRVIFKENKTPLLWIDDTRKKSDNFEDTFELDQINQDFLKSKTIEIFNKSLIDKTLKHVTGALDAEIRKEKESKVNPIITAVLVSTLFLGFFALTIGIGTFLPTVVLPHSPALYLLCGSSSLHLGIQNLNMATPYLLGLGIPVIALTILLFRLKNKTDFFKKGFKTIDSKNPHLKNLDKIIRKTNKKIIPTLQVIESYLNEIKRLEDTYLLSGTSNAILNGILLSILGTIFITTLILSHNNLHIPLSTLSAIHTIESCIGYPAGVLLVLSGYTQSTASVTEFKNAIKSNDKKAQVKAILNIVYSVTTLLAGILTIINLINSPGMYGINFICFICATAFSIKMLIDIIKRYKEIDSKDKEKYLREKFILTKEEVDKKYKEIKKMKKIDVEKWIEKRIKTSTNEDKKKHWISQLAAIQKIEIADKKLEEIKLQIYIEEIYLASIQKIVNFGSLLNPQLVLKALKHLSNEEAVKVDDLFNEVKKELFKKMVIKGFLTGLYASQFAAPALILSAGNKALVGKNIASRVLCSYNLGMGGTSFLDAFVNANPNNRNVSPQTESQDVDLNKDLLKTSKQKMKTA